MCVSLLSTSIRRHFGLFLLTNFVLFALVGACVVVGPHRMRLMYYETLEV